MTASLVLSFDASTPRCVAVLGDVATGEVLGELEIGDEANQASTRLVPGLQDLLASAGIDLGDLVAIGCGRGPGTFTGTRVAVATAMGLCVGAGKPAIAVSTLWALAADIPDAGVRLALLDARRGEVYAQLLRVEHGTSGLRVHALDDERCASAADIVAQLEQGSAEGRSEIVAIGPGVAAAESTWAAAGLQLRTGAGPSPRGLWRATAAAFAQTGPIDPAELRPVYLRQSYAELGINRPRQPPFRSPFA